MPLTERLGQDYLSYEQLRDKQSIAMYQISRATISHKPDMVTHIEDVLGLYKDASPKAKAILDYRNKRIAAIAQEDVIL